MAYQHTAITPDDFRAQPPLPATTFDAGPTTDATPRTAPLKMEAVPCCICETDDAATIAAGVDFEYGTSPDTFTARRCHGCELVYLNPRPALSELARIYPPEYHAFDFSAAEFGLVFRVRQWLEARRVLSFCGELPDAARILDVGCGDGFHLRLLRDFGKAGWQLEGVDLSEPALAMAARAGLTVHQGAVEELPLPAASYDLVFLIQTLEHVADPASVLRAVRNLLRPGGRAVIVTDNTDAPDFRLFQKSHWGGYHFPRHWNLFNAAALRRLAEKVDLEVASLATIVSPVNWVYSLRNSLVDRAAPAWLINRFSLKATASLTVFTAVDTLLQLAGRGALLRAVLRCPV